MRKLFLLLLLCSISALATVPSFDVLKYQQDPPSSELRQMVTEAWLLMAPENGEAPNYKQAYELNLKAYKGGHLEGASNLGYLYEHGWGVEQDDSLAEEWYLKAIASEYHSAQAELGLARIYLQRPHTEENLAKVANYIKQARVTAKNPMSLWKDDYLIYLRDAVMLYDELENLK